MEKNLLDHEKKELRKLIKKESGTDILIYSGEEKLRRRMQDVLCLAGYKVKEAARKDNLIDISNTLSPSLIIFDFVGKEDTAILEQLKSFTLLITSWEDIGPILEDRGIDAEVLHDPYQIEELLNKVKDVLDK